MHTPAPVTALWSGDYSVCWDVFIMSTCWCRLFFIIFLVVYYYGFTWKFTILKLNLDQIWLYELIMDHRHDCFEGFFLVIFLLGVNLSSRD